VFPSGHTSPGSSKENHDAFFIKLVNTVMRLRVPYKGAMIS